MTEIEINLTIEDTNLILGALGEQPFAKVYGLIAKIQGQAQAQLGDGQRVGEPLPVGDSNGDVDGG